MLKSNLILKLAFILKISLILKLSFSLKFENIQNLEFILNILEHPKPSISSLKQPGRMAACYLDITPLQGVGSQSGRSVDYRSEKHRLTLVLVQLVWQNFGPIFHIYNF